MVADTIYMDRALFLAERGRGRTTPNPIVGAVVVSEDGIIVGQGAHLEAGGPHAEVHALDAAGARARGGTIYSTLEPCCHVGRTGPCVERLVGAGIRRAVVAIEDPNPKVRGGGVEYLRARGVTVTVGPGADAARAQNAPFLTAMTRRRPFVILKSAVSADGFVGRAGARVMLTGPDANRWLQRQRAEVDAIAVGADTVLVDDPLLTARGAFRFRPLTRVLFDWRLRIPPTARVFSTGDAGPVIMIVTEAAAEARDAHVRALEHRGIRVERFGERDVRPAVERLIDHDVLSLLVEGGPALQTAFADAGLVDRVQWIVAPVTLNDGVPVSGAGSPIVTVDRLPRTQILGDDVLIEVDVGAPSGALRGSGAGILGSPRATA